MPNRYFRLDLRIANARPHGLQASAGADIYRRAATRPLQERWKSGGKTRQFAPTRRTGQKKARSVDATPGRRARRLALGPCRLGFRNGESRVPHCVEARDCLQCFAGIASSQPPRGGDWLLPTGCSSTDKPTQSSEASRLFQIEISMTTATVIGQMTWISRPFSARIRAKLNCFRIKSVFHIVDLIYKHPLESRIPS